MPESLKVHIDHMRMHRACDELRLHNKEGHEIFMARLAGLAEEFGTTPSVLMAGLSHGNIKKMRNNQNGWPLTLPYALAIILFRETGIDVSAHQAVQFFEELDFMINLQLDVPQRNDSPTDHDIHELQNFALAVHEADAIATDEDDPSREIDLKIGFKQLRLSLAAPELAKHDGPMLGENGPPLRPGYEEDSVISGDFLMRFGGTKPPSWVFENAHEGDLVAGAVEALQSLGTISCAPGANLVAELSARTNALKVRVVGDGRLSKPDTDKMREKMRTALIRKAIEGAGEEFVIYHKRLAG